MLIISRDGSIEERSALAGCVWSLMVRTPLR